MHKFSIKCGMYTQNNISYTMPEIMSSLRKFPPNAQLSKASA